MIRTLTRLATAPAPGWLVQYFGPVALCLIAGRQALGALQDAVLAIGYPFEIAYGEGVVWQQALLIPGARAYSAATGSPFIVFHYPPVYRLLVQAVGILTPDLLVAGRIVSTVATGVFATVAGIIVFAATTVSIARPMRLICSVATSLLILSLPNIRSIGFLMRVDMVADALGPIALLVAFTGRASFVRTACALVIAMLAVFTKQAEVAAGLTIFGLLIRVQLRQTIGAAMLVGGVGLGIVAVLQAVTNGGFLHHIVLYNINRSDWAGWLERLSGELHNLPVIGAVGMVLLLCPQRPGGGLGPDRSRLSRAILVFFGLNLLSLAALGKSGASFNYLNSLYGSGCMLVGIGLAQLLSGKGSGPPIGTAIACVLSGWISVNAARQMEEFLATQGAEQQQALVALVEAATKPVASDDLVLTLRARRSVLFEPAIATELAITGRWDERPLIELINKGGVAFAITAAQSFDDARRSPGVLTALQTAFPQTRQITIRHWLHEPK